MNKQQILLKRTAIRLLPDDWEVNKIEDIADVEYGKANPKTKGDVPVIGSGGVFASAKMPLVDYPTYPADALLI